MSKNLVLAASAAVALGSFVAADADARYLRGFHRYHGHAVCIPRRSYQDPMFAPNAPRKPANRLLSDRDNVRPVPGKLSDYRWIKVQRLGDHIDRTVRQPIEQ
jgi:hypothetical protein